MSGEIIMIKIRGRDNLVYNINLDAIAAVQYANVELPIEKQFDQIWQRGMSSPIQLSPGTFAAAVAALKVQYTPNLNKLIFIGTTP